MSSGQAGSNCPGATALPLAHGHQGGCAAGCASGRPGDVGRPWKRESFVKRGGQAVGGPEEGGKTGEAVPAVVKLLWGFSERKSEEWKEMRRKRRKMWEVDTYS